MHYYNCHLDTCGNLNVIAQQNESAYIFGHSISLVETQQDRLPLGVRCMVDSAWLIAQILK